MVTKTPLLLLLTSAISLLHVTHAQAPAQAPAPVRNFAYTFMDARNMYIQGGYTGSTTLNQFYSLDLTAKVWSTSDAPWNSLNLGTGPASAPQDAGHSAVFLRGLEEIMFWDSNSTSRYNIKTNSWKAPMPLPPQAVVGVGGLKMASDPNTGLVYIPSGYQGNLMGVYDPTKNTMTSVPMPLTAPPGLVRYGLVWSTVRRKLLMFGGSRGEPGLDELPSDKLYEFDPVTRAWATPIVQTGGPVGVNYPCMASANFGSKIVVFGGGSGTPLQQVVIGNIYILDVPTMTWTQGESAPEALRRKDAACAVAGDNFVVWGGSDAKENVAPAMGTPMVYHLKAQKWTKDFSPLPPSAQTSGDSANPTGTDPENKDKDNGSGSSNVGAIAGGIAGAVAVIAGVVGFLVYKRRRQHQPATEVKHEMDSYPFTKQQDDHNSSHHLSNQHSQEYSPVAPAYSAPHSPGGHVQSEPVIFVPQHAQEAGAAQAPYGYSLTNTDFKYAPPFVPNAGGTMSEGTYPVSATVSSVSVSQPHQPHTAVPPVTATATATTSNVIRNNIHMQNHPQYVPESSLYPFQQQHQQQQQNYHVNSPHTHSAHSSSPQVLHPDEDKVFGNAGQVSDLNHYQRQNPQAVPVQRDPQAWNS